MHALVSRLKKLFLSSWHPWAWFAAIGFLLYAQTFLFGFSYLDDNVLIIKNIDHLRNPLKILQIFQNDVFHLSDPAVGYYRPLLTLSFMVNAVVAGPHPFFYHLTNVVIHVVVTGLVFQLLARLGFSRKRSFLLSVLFLAHPALVPAVAWIPGRNDPLLTLFVILSFLFFIQSVDHKRLSNYIGHLFFFFCALLTKESATVLPALCLFYIFLKNTPSHFFLAKRFYFGWAGGIAVWVLLRSMAVKGDPGLVLSASRGIFSNSPAFFLYLGKVFFPFNLSVFPVLPDSGLLYGFISAALLFVLFFFVNKKAKMAFFGIAWFLIFIFFALLRSASKFEIPDFLEHRLYLPMVGCLIFIASVDLFKFFERKKFFGYFLFATYFFTFVILNLFYVQKFKDRLTFWKNAVGSSPSAPLAHANLGAMYYLDGQMEPAIYEYHKALSLNPSQKMVHNNLGLIFSAQGRWPEAEQEFMQEISLNPLYADAYYNFSTLRYYQKKYAEARLLAVRALELDSGLSEAYNIAALACLKDGKQDEAARFIQELQKRGIPFQEEFSGK